MTKHAYYLSGSAPKLYPTETFFANLMWSDEEGISVPYCCPFADEWGKPVSMYVDNEKEFPVPSKIDMVWLSLVENQFYSIEEKLPQKEIDLLLQETNEKNGKPLYDYIIVGMAPFGGVAVWLHGDQHAKLVSWLKAEEVDVDMGFFCPSTNLSKEEYVNMMLKSVDEAYANFTTNGLPPHDLYDKYMQQFSYRFIPVLKKWDKDNETWMEYREDELLPKLDFIEVKCHDGTFDRLRDGSLLNYHEAGKPSRVCVGWHVGKHEYSAYFFFSHEELAQVFRTCYGAHPETQVDFLLMIDPESDKYEPALFRYGMNEPLPIGPDACQVLAFRNKFECYHSSNYTQPKDAWR